MYCVKCGNYLDDDAKFCNRCGERTANADTAGAGDSPYLQQGGSDVGGTTYGVGTGYTQYGDHPTYGGSSGGAFGTAPTTLPMNWFKFVIYVQLFLTTAVALFNAVSLFTGLSYSYEAEHVYSAFPSLKICDLLFGVLYVALGVMCLVARSRLAGFKAGAPTLYVAVYAAALLLSVIYPLAMSMATGMPLSETFDGNYLFSIMGSLGMILCNLTYFGKRKHLFVNR